MQNKGQKKALLGKTNVVQFIQKVCSAGLPHGEGEGWAGTTGGHI